MKTWLCCVVCWVALVGELVAGVKPSAWTLGETVGRVLVRDGTTGGYRGPVVAGMVLREGDVVLTGPEGRVELRGGGPARWRIGEQAVWRWRAAGVELLAGTALAAGVPDDGVEVAAAARRVKLHGGVWLLTAVDNEGLKIVALDKGRIELPAAPSAPGATDGAGAAGAAAVPALKLAAGELVFAPPGGGGFGPVVTVFLDELLGTSRLVGGFAGPLPQVRRLVALGEAQRARLQNVSNAFVGGARDASGFQLAVPKEKAAGRPGGEPSGAKR